jgi:hypothetical protein
MIVPSTIVKVHCQSTQYIYLSGNQADPAQRSPLTKGDQGGCISVSPTQNKSQKTMACRNEQPAASNKAVLAHPRPDNQGGRSL